MAKGGEMQLDKLQTKLRLIAKISSAYAPECYDPPPLVENVTLRGYSEAVLTLSVFKTGMPKHFAAQQAIFMAHLGPKICPRILAMNGEGYCMEYLQPFLYEPDTPKEIEFALEHHVWNRKDLPNAQLSEVWRKDLKESINIDIPDWAFGTFCVIHGDPTLDNCLMTEDGDIRITDPIPVQWLKRPSIRAIDHGKILQSILGWEVVLRGYPMIRYEWPDFMRDYETACRAVFWCLVALKRIHLRGKDNNQPALWAKHTAEELQECVSSF
jgi:hypothetical protein